MRDVNLLGITGADDRRCGWRSVASGWNESGCGVADEINWKREDIHSLLSFSLFICLPRQGYGSKTITGPRRRTLDRAPLASAAQQPGTVGALFGLWRKCTNHCYEAGSTRSTNARQSHLIVNLTVVPLFGFRITRIETDMIPFNSGYIV